MPSGAPADAPVHAKWPDGHTAPIAALPIQVWQDLLVLEAEGIVLAPKAAAAPRMKVRVKTRPVPGDHEPRWHSPPRLEIAVLAKTDRGMLWQIHVGGAVRGQIRQEAIRGCVASSKAILEEVAKQLSNGDIGVDDVFKLRDELMIAQGGSPRHGQ